MGWTEKDIPDLSGRVAVVTGGNGGLGYQTVLALAGAGAHVVVAARDPEKTAAATARIRERHPAASLEVVPLDLGDLSVVSTAADAVLAAHDHVDLLVNNAGVMAMPQRSTADGFEMQLGVDHLGHWAFTAHLLPALLRAPAARVVTVTSTARFMGGTVRPADPHIRRRRYQPWSAYAHAKWANYHFGLGLQERFERAGAAAASLIAHPGLSNTDLQARTAREGGAGWTGGFAEAVTARVGMSPLEGTRPQLRAATDPAARGGQLYAPRFGSHGPPVERPILRRFDLRRRIDELWEVSERETGVPLVVPPA
ncbi:oxidoreductase [Blastococcus sp. CCUG 61487]|uniref:oxidoreductase n=1 Tax=Blastococcus sp. CCUG 61487 TaxID=1840703 RepID=UPI0010BF67AE|nr:oxidoreductase [Blastococcus sp. CCUG 61487]TKJ27412.1 short-chain dehydrogenase [Blastococcus sp. CCUG 61487]